MFGFTGCGAYRGPRSHHFECGYTLTHRERDRIRRQCEREPAPSLTPEQRAEVHHKLGLKPKPIRQRTRPVGCLDCGDPAPETENPLDRLCDRCRDKRGGG